VASLVGDYHRAHGHHRHRNGGTRGARTSGWSGRAAAWLVGVGTLVWLAWQILGNTIADTRRADPDVSLSWRPQDAAALVALASREFVSAPDDKQVLMHVADMARQALQANPLQENALRVLALSAERAGHHERTRSLMQLVAARSLRDTEALLWLFNDSVRRNDASGALSYLDPILRTRPQLRAAFAGALTSFARVASARPALVDLLGRDPPWRGWALGEIARTADPAVTNAVLSSLAATSAPPRAGELKPYLDRLIAEERYKLAFLTWLGVVSVDSSRPVPFAFNGDFELPLSGLPFDWRIAPIKGAATEIVESPDGRHGHVLQVVFGNARVPYRQVSKLLMLPPGPHRLSGDVEAERLVNERGVVWRITCADGIKVVLAASAPVVGTNPWQPFAVEFVVPETGCRAQWLRLELAARFAIEEQVSGTVRYDNLTIR
jgi:hypothetical protein